MLYILDHQISAPHFGIKLEALSSEILTVSSESLAVSSESLYALNNPKMTQVLDLLWVIVYFDQRLTQSHNDSQLFIGKK